MSEEWGKDWDIVRERHEHREHGGRTNFIQVCPTCEALARLRARQEETLTERNDAVLRAEAAEARVEELQKWLNERNADFDAAEDRAEAAEARVEELEAGLREYQGFHEAVGEILSRSRNPLDEIGRRYRALNPKEKP